MAVSTTKKSPDDDFLRLSPSIGAGRAEGLQGWATLSGMLRAYRGIWPTVDATAYVDASAQLVGDVTLGAHSSVWMNAVLRGDVHSIRVGERSNIQDGAVLHGMKGLYAVTVGDGCTIGHNATVHGCTLEDDVLIGMGAVVLNGAVIGRGSIVAAGAVIPERIVIPPGSLVAGIPGKMRRACTETDLESIRHYAAAYVGYMAAYKEER
jgi:carbonic anhydrase/acetyltransferase-like protein (isoleucine patch superfamily)